MESDAFRPAKLNIMTSTVDFMALFGRVPDMNQAPVLYICFLMTRKLSCVKRKKNVYMAVTGTMACLTLKMECVYTDPVLDIILSLAIFVLSPPLDVYLCLYSKEIMFWLFFTKSRMYANMSNELGNSFLYYIFLKFHLN